MSWDVLLIKAPPEVTSFSTGKLPEEFILELDSRSDVTSLLNEVVPEIQYLDANWARIRTEDFSIELNIGNNDPIEALMLHIYGKENSIEVISRICQRTGWRAYDTSNDGFIDFDQKSAPGFQHWKSYKEKIIEFINSENNRSNNDQS
jgi:hypothetical protein